MSEKVSFSLIICFISFLGFMGGTIYIAAMPELSQVFHVPSPLINFTLTIYFIGFIFGTAFSGPLSEVYGRIEVITLFLFLYCASNLLCSFSHSLSWFATGRFLQGLGSAGGPIIAIALVADRYEGSDYYKVISLILIMIGLGGGTAPIFGSLILNFFGWKSIFYILTTLGILALLFVFFGKIDSRAKHKKFNETFRKYRFFMTHPLFRYYCLMIGVLYGAFYAFIIISPYIFRLQYGWSIIEFAWIGVALAFGEGLGSFLDEELIEKIGSQKIFITGLVIVSIALLLLTFFGHPSQGIWVLLMVTLFTIGANLTSSCLVVRAVKMEPKFTGIASSLINLSKIILASLVLVLVLFLPNTLEVVDGFILVSLGICVLVYIKIRSAFY